MFLGIDIGTSSVKAIVVDESGSIRTESSSPLSVSRPQPLFSEQDPDSWWGATVQAVRSLAPTARGSVTAIGLAGQMHGATLLDAADRSLRPAILWNDGRSSLECVELERAEPEARRITGNIVMPGFTAPKLLWIRKHEPHIFQRLKHVLLPKDYVRLKLTGERVTDMSDASGTAWLDVGQRDWSDRMLAATGLDRAYMPTLAEGNAASGLLRPQAAEQLGLPVVVVAAGAGDNAASAAGMGVVSAGEAFLSLGTSGVLFVATEQFLPNPDQAAHAFCHCLPQRWHQMAVILSAASALDWFSSVNRGAQVTELVAAAQSRGLQRTSPFFLPYLSGERTPHNDPHSRGVFFGLSSDTSSADLAVAVLEGVALAFADGLDVLGQAVGTISVVGGGARFGYWGQLLAAALNRPLTYRKGGEIGAAYGAARLGRLALTGEQATAVCAPPPVSHVVQPQAPLAAVLAERRPIFRKLYLNLKASFREFTQ
jgi:xylulokinase